MFADNRFHRSGTRLARRGLLLAAAVFCCLPRPAAAEEPAVDFAEQVLPIFKQHCFQCHGPEVQQSNYRIDNKLAAFSEADFGEPAIVPGDSAAGLLLGFVTGENDYGMLMPPPNFGRSLNEEEIATLRAWIDAGAEWPEELAGGDPDEITTSHWSFQPVERPEAPEEAGDWAAGGIDRFILAKLAEAELEPSQRADRVTLIRRLYMNMLGLPPTPEEIERFVEDRRSDAWPRLVEQVLDNPHYGERWGRHWLDVVRFAESDGFETNHERPHAFHYRDYVIRAFNEDKPYNEFVFEQLAGDTVGAHEALGFIVGGAHDIVGSPDVTLQQMQRQDELADMVGTTSTAFLGLTMACARCHNHMFDPLLQKDYFAMAAVFGGIRHGNRTIAMPRSEEDTRRIEQLVEKLDALERQLARYEPEAHPGRTLLLGDGDVVRAEDAAAGIIHLQQSAGREQVLPGAAWGHADYPGEIGRLPYVGDRQFTRWHNSPGVPVAAYRPRVEGKFRIWISWGAGRPEHTDSAEYVLDLDGDPAGEDDQRVIATVDQRGFTEGPHTGEPGSLWSGFRDAGVHSLRPESALLLRGGDEGTIVTAAEVVLQEVFTGQPAETEQPDDAGQPLLRGPVSPLQNVERIQPVEARYVRFTILATNSGSEPCLDELEVWTAESDGPPRNVALHSAGARATSSGDYAGNPIHRLEHLNDGRYGNSHSWISNQAGRGWVQLELPETVRIDRIVWGRDREGQFSDRLAVQYRIEVAVEPDQWQLVASSADRVGSPAGDAEGFRLARLDGESNSEPAEAASRRDEWRGEWESLREAAQTTLYIGNIVDPPLTHRLYRGDPMAPREVVAPDIPTVQGSLELPPDAPEQQRRVEMGRWLAAADNPLTARVMVNRIWHYHFGTGLVETTSDFGGNGARPSHPELLDWLASEFVDSGWSVKQMHRLILLSSTFQQSGEPRAEAMRVDASCRLLWRFPPRRGEAELIRDSILAVSGALDRRMGGPGFLFYEPNSNYSRNWIPKHHFGPPEFRRMVYATKLRMEQDSVFGVFDCPDAGQATPQRTNSTTALQALNLLNSPFLLQQSELLARRLVEEAGSDPADQVRRACQLAWGRLPTDEELSASLELIEDYELKDFCRALFNTNEFLFIP